MMGFHFHPIMQHFSVDDRRYYPLFEEIAALGAAVMIDVGMTGMGAGMPGGMGAKTQARTSLPPSMRWPPIFQTSPSSWPIPGYPWIDETTAVALHKGNVYWEMSGWAPKYLPPSLVRDMRGRLQDKMMFGSDYPSIPYPRPIQGMGELGLSDAFLQKFYHGNAGAFLGSD
jgi:predicted TIM-barrel fold metal-dependent hydrolase